MATKQIVGAVREAPLQAHYAHCYLSHKSLILFLMLIPSVIFASAWSSVRKGVNHFEKEKHSEALESFRAAELDNPKSAIVHFDIASALYKGKKYDKAIKEYAKAAELSSDAKILAKAYYGMGNSLFQSDSLLQAITAYQKSLDYDPTDKDAKYNLELARALVKELAKKKKQPQQQQGQGQQKKQKSAQNDSTAQQQKKQEQKQAQADSTQQQQNKEGKQLKKKKKMSQEEAERILKALEQNEKEEQSKRQLPIKRQGKHEKDW